MRVVGMFGPSGGGVALSWEWFGIGE